MITPSLNLTATERVLPNLALDFTTASLDPRVSFTRTTSASNPATYIDSNGLITSATNNQPRFDYDPLTKQIKGLLIEEQRTNLLAYSSEFNNAYWQTASNVSVEANQAIAPDGTLTADILREAATTATHRLSANNNSGITGTTVGTTYTMSCYFKAGGGTSVPRLSISNLDTGTIHAFFNLGTKTIATTTAGNGGVIVATSMIEGENGWFRCILTGSVSGGNAPMFAFIGFGQGTTQTYAGSTNNYIYIWGSQFEAGAFATSYIPTTTTALTRNADVATMTGQGVAAQGTFVVDATVVSGKTLLTSGSVTFAATALTAQKTAVAYDINSVNKSINAGAVTSSAGATASTDITLGNGGIFRKVALYAPKMIDAELQAFSK